MSRKVAQPPINRLARDPERRDFGPGLVLALIGVLVALCGARHLTGVETLAGNTAWETQLIRAFTVGGLQFPAPAPPPLLLEATGAGPPSAAAVRAAPISAAPVAPRVDTGANTPCPT